uniref:Uncharacterized protein n=1 Tax=Plectus sambesii TaxID=2011161 RepID=A0A914WYV0_9BILA
MLFSLAILLFIFPTVAALTDLQANCTGPDRRYNGTSCYVLGEPGITHSAAKLLCNHYLGYSGHLVHIRNAAVQATARELTTTYFFANVRVYTGLEPINSSAALTDKNNWGYYYRNGTVVVPAYQQPWAAAHPSTTNRAYYTPSGDYIATQAENYAYYFLCEYEEALKQPVTDLEEKCANLTSASVFTLFVNDVCYVVQPAVTKNYNDAKVACNALSGCNGQLAHVRTMSELWIADAVRSAAGVNLMARIGIEQTNLSSTDPNN